VAGSIASYVVLDRRAKGRQAEAYSEARSVIEEAERSAEAVRKEAEISAKEEAMRLKDQAEEEQRSRRSELDRLEERLDNREGTLNQRESELEKMRNFLDQREEEMKRRYAELEEREREKIKALEEVAGLSRDEAELRLMNDLEHELEGSMARLVREKVMEAEEKAESEAGRIIATAMERLASEQTIEATVKTVSLPSDDMKGRVIGKEGRNIRAFETATGVDVIIDDTPETVALSCFDPVRREVARVSMERLLKDGRINAGRIEQVVGKVRKEVDEEIKRAGRQAVYDANISGGVHGELVHTLGALKFRTSHGQNVLAHSVEVAHLAGMMAAELGANVKVSRRAALLHDVGKAVDHEVEGTHAMIGGRLSRKYGESEEVARAVSAHHHEVEMESVEDVLIAVADAVSASRPGARRETTEIYLERLRNLEELASAYDGVEKAYAIQAGREVRVMVKPTEVDDDKASELAHRISRQIEDEMDYPGQVRVTVIRESRASEVAK
jgi:ribonuclease Y